MASEVCLIDKNAARAEAEAEDIRHAGIFLGNPLVTGTAGKDSLNASIDTNRTPKSLPPAPHFLSWPIFFRSTIIIKIIGSAFKNIFNCVGVNFYSKKNCFNCNFFNFFFLQSTGARSVALTDHARCVELSPLRSGQDSSVARTRFQLAWTTRVSAGPLGYTNLINRS